MIELTRRKIGLCYLARGADADWSHSIERFVAAYQRFTPAADHRLYVIYKGFARRLELDRARSLFARLDSKEVHVDDTRFDIGAYVDALPDVAEDLLCFLNAFSEPACEAWLAKMAVNFGQPGVGLVGATGSFERMPANSRGIVAKFPNIHLRSNAFMIERETFLSITRDFDFGEKTDAFLFESGPQSMTRRIRARGREVLVIGRNGRGYRPSWWPHSRTFRCGTQSNLIVVDNQTRNFDAMHWDEKRYCAQATWGPYLQETNAMDEDGKRIPWNYFWRRPASGCCGATSLDLSS